jgi:hypothetical protein
VSRQPCTRRATRCPCSATPNRSGSAPLAGLDASSSRPSHCQTPTTSHGRSSAPRPSAWTCSSTGTPTAGGPARKPPLWSSWLPRQFAHPAECLPRHVEPPRPRLQSRALTAQTRPAVALDPAVAAPARSSRCHRRASRPALHRLGITRPDLLSRAADIDRAGERLILDAAAEVETSRRHRALELNRSTGTTTLIDRALMSGDPRAAALLRRPEPPARKPLEREAEP